MRLGVRQNQVVEGCTLFDPGAVVEGCRLERCELRGFAATVRRDWPPLEQRLTIRDVHLSDCTNGGAVLQCAGVLLSDVVVENFRDEIWADCCGLERVTLVGAFTGLTVRSDVPPASDERREYWAALVTANEEIESEAEWCLDVSKAFLSKSTVRGIDFAKIVIDPERQALITPESVAGAEDVFDQDELVGDVGASIRLTMSGSRNYPLVDSSRGTKPDPRASRLVAKLYDNHLALPPRVAR